MSAFGFTKLPVPKTEALTASVEYIDFVWLCVGLISAHRILGPNISACSERIQSEGSSLI